MAFSYGPITDRKYATEQMWIILSNYVRYLNHIRYTVPETGNHHGGTCQHHLRLLYDFVQCGVSLFH